MLVTLLQERKRKKKLRQQSRQEMRNYLDRSKIDKLIKFSSRNGTMQDVIFYREVCNWKTMWSPLLSRQSCAAQARLESYKHAALIYFFLVDSQCLRRQVSLPVPVLSALVSIFSDLTFSPGKTAKAQREKRRRRQAMVVDSDKNFASGSTLVSNSNTSSEANDIVDPNIDDIDFANTFESSIKLKRLLEGTLEDFGIHIWDEALRVVQATVFKTTWTPFILSNPDYDTSQGTQSVGKTIDTSSSRSAQLARVESRSAHVRSNSTKIESASSAAALTRMMPMM